jgi:uncharacterized damage-inducible protein DinB
MKRVAFLLLLTAPFALAQNQKKRPTDLRGILLESLRTTHNQEDWFVPASVAVDGLTADQARWKPAGKDGHSVGQLAYHIWYWNTRELNDFKGVKNAPFDGNNNETFDDFNAAQWNDLVGKLNQIMADWETAVEQCDEATLEKNASLIEHVATHNAYHIGQILYVRKLEGAWNPAKGVQ